MRRFDVEALSESDRAFVEAIAGIHGKLEALKIAFGGGPHQIAICAMQAMIASLVAAAVKAR